MAHSKKYRTTTIGLINKKAFWNAYDHLGRLLVINVLSVLLFMTIIGIPFGIIGLYSITRKIADYEDITLKEYWEPVRKYIRRVIGLTVFLVLFTILLLANLYFYNALLNQADSASKLTYVFSGMQGLMIWLSIFFIMFSFYIFPVLFQFDNDFKTTLKNSFFLMMDNLKVSFYLLFSWILWMVAGLATGVIGFFLSFSIIAVISQTAVREILAQYRAAGLDENEEKRGLRDLLKPWN